MNKFNFYKILNYLIASVWLINGLVCKVLNFVPRHQEIVGKILGTEYSQIFTVMIGFSEIAMAFWVLTRILPKFNAIFQMVIVISMNVLEFILTPELLLWGKFNLVFALFFALIIYYQNFILEQKLKTNSQL